MSGITTALVVGPIADENSLVLFLTISIPRLSPADQGS